MGEGLHRLGQRVGAIQQRGSLALAQMLSCPAAGTSSSCQGLPLTCSEAGGSCTRFLCGTSLST